VALTHQRPVLSLSDSSRQPRLLAYFGHHKCASSWLADIMRDVCAAAGLAYASVHNPRGFGGDLNGFVARENLDFLIYVNANKTYVSAMESYRGFHVIRDPRDIVVSSYFSHLYSHPTTDWPELVAHRRELQAVDKERGLFIVIDFLEGVLNDIETWDYNDARVLELKMEDLVQQPYDALVQALTFLGLVDRSRAGLPGQVVRTLAAVKRRRPRLVPLRMLPLPASVVTDAVARNAFAAKTNGRSVGNEDSGSHYRKGVMGDWVNHFDMGHRKYFKARYGQLLVKLGYEADLKW
jgi:hypothetical protein